MVLVRKTRDEIFGRYEQELELELDGAVELPASRLEGAVAGGVMLAVAVALTALNLRPAITSVGPVLPELEQAFDISGSWAGALNALPVLCFAAAGVCAPRLSQRIGLGRTISAALIATGAGLMVRTLGGLFVLIGGTLVATAGIALINVLVPVVIKGSFRTRLGLMTGVYTAALQAGGGLGSAITPIVDDAFDSWRFALGGWGALAVLAVLAWLGATRGFDQASAAAPATRSATRSLLRSRLAWAVTMFFACQSFLAFVVLDWLPEVFIENGVSKRSAGLLVGSMALVGITVSLVVAPLAARNANQSGWIVVLNVLGIAGVVGLTIAPAASPLLWTVLVALGMGAFPLALTVIALRTRTTAETARLSGMAQGFGYLVAGLGPFLFGLLHDLAGGWTVPWVMVLGVCLLQIPFGVLAGQNRYI